MTKITREVIIEAAKQATIKQGSPISRRDFIRISGISNHQIYKLFPNGGWAEAKRLANLEPHPHRTS